MKGFAVVDNQATEKYLRIASISIALYDYIITLPAEWRFYRSQSSLFRLRLACILFILIRYGSIIVMILSNYGVFSTSFTHETCKHYYMISPVFKVIQTMISQVILGVRTFNIARRDRRIGITLVVLYFISVSLEWFTNMFNRIQPTAVVVSIHANSVLFRERNSGKILSAWFYYTVSMLYDLAVLTISTVYLLRYNPLSSRLEQLVRVYGFYTMIHAAGFCCNMDYEPTDSHPSARSFSGARTDDMELDICGCVKPLVTLDHTDECGVSSSWDNPMER
ncbi:hypothetical protein BDR03DRAFT_984661 [Suillus americanus]|nr:hypothetical protein BDR03DRAFT_984661 [Suillus americanus]